MAEVFRRLWRGRFQRVVACLGGALLFFAPNALGVFCFEQPCDEVLLTLERGLVDLPIEDLSFLSGSVVLIIQTMLAVIIGI